MNIRRTYLFISLVLIFCFLNINGQNQDILKQISTEHGLSNNRITSMIQDGLGFIWVGTKNGLNKYDGVNFKKYNQKNSGISSNDISSLLIDKKGRIWIGTIGGGVNIYNPSKDKFQVYKNSNVNQDIISSNDIHAIIEDNHGNIWLGSEMGIDLYVEKSKDFKTFRHQAENKGSLNFISVWTIIETVDRNLFLGTYGDGLYTFDIISEKFTPIVPSFEKEDNLSLEFINTLLYGKEDELLIGTNGSGLLSLDLKTNNLTGFFSSNNKVDAPIIRTLYKDRNQNIWIGTDGDGIIRLSKDNISNLSIKQYVYDNRLRTSLSNNTVNNIFEDNQSNIWIGTAWKGLNVIKKRVNNSSFYFSDGMGYNASPVLSVFKEESILWMGTDGNGLNKYDLETKEVTNYHTSIKAPLGGDYIQLVKKKSNGQYWIGTFANGLILFDSQKGKIKQFKRDNLNETSLPYNDVRDIIELPTGDLWVGTWGGGLSFLDFKTEVFKNFRFSKNNKNSLSNDNVISLLLDKEGGLWIGTHGGGLNRFDTKTNQFSSYKVSEQGEKSIGSNYIFDLLLDKAGILWLATKEGLNRFDTRTQVFKKFAVGNSAITNTVVSLIDDSYGNIWMGTKEGLFKYNIKTNTIEEFETDFNEFHVNSVCKDSQGVLYFGGVDGVISFNPNTIFANTVNPKVLFTDLKLFDKSVPVGDHEILKRNISIADEVTINYNQSVITFEFSALEYPFSDANYLVKMEGFEDNWRAIGNQQTATYTNLSSGDYVFKVKTQKKNNSLDEVGFSELKIKVLPPFWKTWWAYLTYLVLFIILLWVIKHYTLAWIEVKNNLRLEKLQREQEDKLHELKQRFFTNISHEIRTPLTLIIGTINSLMRSNVDAKEQKQLTNLRRSTGRLMNLVSELLNIRKLETGNINLHVSENDMVFFIHEIFLAFSQHAIANNIDYKFDKPENKIYVWFDKIQLEKTIYNLLTNAFKFTSSGDKILLSVFEDRGAVKIVVNDTGQGIPKDKLPQIFERFYQNEDAISENLGFGIGLSIAKDIVELHSGQIKVESVLEKGSRFIITLPLGKAHFNQEQIASEINEEDIISNYSKTTANNFGVNEFEKSLVLIVEDNPHLLDYLAGLMSQNFQVIVAENGKIGLELAKEKSPDIIVSDVMMPVMDGITLCSEVKTNILTSHIPVILLTARTMVENIMEGFEMGADDYLVKPFNEDVLKVRIKNLLASRKHLREKYINEILLSPKEMAFTSPDQEFLTKLNGIIEAQIDNSEFSIEELAAEMAMSHSNLYKKIKALTAMTTVAFVRDFRLKRAAQLLKQGNMSVIDVCFKVGYTDRRHFSQEFKKKFSITPSAYAKENLI
ncbi:two-component regulator propeller domain-containing protein [Algibacter agarivorans]|uniref:histidine kinase n=1 Tax=Algibacter agarivorans TaxID=1109741 RepID=A0ABP9GVZ6_9FLAO